MSCCTNTTSSCVLKGFVTKAFAPANRALSRSSTPLRPEMAMIGGCVYAWCSHRRWWIIRQAPCEGVSGWISSVERPDRLPLRETRLHPSASPSIFTDFLATWNTSPIRLAWRSSGNLWQGAREDFPCCPPSEGFPCGHSWRPMPVALR